MKLEDAAFPLTDAWSSPFVRWQGSLADVSSLDLAVAVTRDAFEQRAVDRNAVDGLVLGMTIPQISSFYAAPWTATRIGLEGISGPVVAQACATSVACLVAAATSGRPREGRTSLVLTTDRTSNGPLMVYPSARAMGGSPTTENWVLDSFSADPATGQSMAATADNVAREGRMTREELDSVTLLRWHQYQSALDNDQAFQRRYMQSVRIQAGKSRLEVDADQGVHEYSQASLAVLRPVHAESVITFGTQTHPADGCAGVLLSDVATARERACGAPVVTLIAAASARAGSVQMPKAATMAAQSALEEAGLSVHDMELVSTHNPFAVNDLWFSQQLGYPLEKMNVRGCSLIYGHPQGPTGLRGIVELAWSLNDMGGGYGLFTGCAAGDTGAALIIRVG